MMHIEGIAPSNISAMAFSPLPATFNFSLSFKLSPTFVTIVSIKSTIDGKKTSIFVFASSICLIGEDLNQLPCVKGISFSDKEFKTLETKQTIFETLFKPFTIDFADPAFAFPPILVPISTIVPT